MRTREPASFLRENVVAVLILLATSLNENVVFAGTSYQMLGILSFSDRERASPPSTEISALTFVVKKKSTMKLSGVSIFRVQARKLKIKCRPRSPRPRP